MCCNTMTDWFTVVFSSSLTSSVDYVSVLFNMTLLAIHESNNIISSPSPIKIDEILQNSNLRRANIFCPQNSQRCGPAQNGQHEKGCVIHGGSQEMTAMPNNSKKILKWQFM